MLINQIQSANSKNTNPNFRALKNIKFKNGFTDEISKQESLTKALKQSKGAKEFFEKNDGTVTFTTDAGFSGVGGHYVDAIMELTYKTKNKLFPIFSKKTTISGTSSTSLDRATNRLCNIIKESSCNDFYGIKHAKKQNLKKLKDAQKNINEQLKNNNFFE